MQNIVVVMSISNVHYAPSASSDAWMGGCHRPLHTDKDARIISMHANDYDKVVS